MLAGLNDVWRAAGEHRAFSLTTVALAGSLVSALAVLRQQIQLHAIERERERRIREEMEAYACLDARLGPSQDLATLGRRVCEIVIRKSPFRRVALLARDSKGGLLIAGSSGMDEPLLRNLGAWAASIVEPVHGTGSSWVRLRSMLGPGIEVGSRSLAVSLAERTGVPGGHSLRTGVQQPERLIVVPFATTGDRRLLGAVVVCANHVLSIRRRLVDEALAPLETLAAKLGRAMENVVLAERLLRAEKLTGLGLLAGGIAHALNNPLTAVMGFAELIVETAAAEPRVQQDAGTIVREAQRMRSTVESLLNLWRPAIQREEPVDMAAMVRELGCACEHKLAERGVRLAIEIGDGVPNVRGNPDRLRQVMEHLLNNAAQAIATYPGPAHAIRIAVTCDSTPAATGAARSLHIIVSDTGHGFREPGSVFDPFYTTREPGEGAGLGLSLCYSIVREHNGDITAFNLHPHGAAVMIELPADSAASTFQGPRPGTGPDAGIDQAA